MSVATSSFATTSEKSTPTASNRWDASEWQRPLPKKVIRSFADESLDEPWNAWLRYLSHRKCPCSLAQLLSSRQSPLIWSTVVSLRNEETENIIALTQHHHYKKKNHEREIQERLSSWLLEADTVAIDSSHALECVAWAWVMPFLATHCREPLWWSLLDRLIQNAADACQLDVTKSPLSAILLGGELPLVLAHVFPERKATAELLGLAITNLSESLTELLDGEGMLPATHLPLLRPLLGCWTRCRAVMETRRKFLWSNDAEDQYRWLVTQTLRMSRPGGAMVFNGMTFGRSARDLFRAALQLGGNDIDAAAADCLFARPKDGATITNEALSPAYHSEWSALAILRNRWSRKARQLAITYADGQNRIELCQGPSVILSGNWSFEITHNGQMRPQDATAEWDEIAFESDEDVDYLELEMEVTPQIRIQRSFLLARRDQILILADAVLCEKADPIEYRSHLPLADEMTTHLEADTCELTLKSPQPCTRILPLWLPEWRSANGHGKLDVQQRHILMEHSGVGRLFAPLFFDLSRKRNSRPLTWRQLAVGQMRQNVSDNQAVGFRVQIGQEQWLLYRSLTEAANRTVLGQNLMGELHVSRFLKTGEVEELIEVQ